ncbi:MAG TPA: serine/threonine-protein kinase [Polyangiaceae bacterium]|nr:serine/threonine-protein kinase [Polyangiaceae bacterium]HOD21791.1 serine/threonine-protein kinase [Polyangiaceae bacterium]HOE49501.1 serine/threonine-protein kinase [Polyangiaceae bacterium]HOH02241.1 serine/threonine-protein kinase [Polyangiaceae bacterium]HOR36613.1 serine/threonine-protein kinase [Polyangiaceae bacterium]
MLASSGEHGAVSVDIGDVLVGKYKVESILGQGGMGVVVAAMHLHLQERVALKFLRPGAGRSEEFNARFMREAQVSAKLRNEHIVKVSDVGMLESGAPYMVMEYISGVDLRSMLKKEGPLAIPRAIDYIIQACEGLAEAHSFSVVHRDLKPSNLFVTTRRDGTELIKVLDFGISKANLVSSSDLEDLTAAGALLGSPKYMSPEQLTNTAQVDERSDVWSLGVVLYEMLAGTPPFVADTHAATCMRVLGTELPPSLCARRPDVPPELEAAIFRALERDLNRRTPNVAEFAEDVIDAVGALVPHQVLVSIERIRRTIESHSLASSGATPRPRERRNILAESMTSSSFSPASGSGAVVTANKQPQRKGLLVGIAVLLSALIVALAALISQRSDNTDPVMAGATVSVSATPSAPVAVVESPATSSTSIPAEPPRTAESIPSPGTTPEPTPTKVIPGPTRWSPPPVRSTAPAPTGTPTSTKKVDPLEERQ